MSVKYGTEECELSDLYEVSVGDQERASARRLRFLGPSSQGSASYYNRAPNALFNVVMVSLTSLTCRHCGDLRLSEDPVVDHL